MSLRTDDVAEAERALETFAAETMKNQYPQPEGTHLTWALWAQKMCKRARENAKQKGRPYDLDTAFVERMLAEQDYRCAVTRMRLSSLQAYRNPFAPSLDQIRPGGGYLPDNVRVVSVLVNTAMNGWGEGPLRRLILESRLVEKTSEQDW